MKKKYFDGGAFQVLPLLLATMMAAPFGSALLEKLGYEATTLSQFIAGSISGAIVGIVSWIVMVAIDSVFSPQK
jgi:hypothetical protein